MPTRVPRRHLGYWLVLALLLAGYVSGQEVSDRVLILVEAGKIALDRGDLALALEKAEAAVAIDVRRPEALAIAAEAALRLGDGAKAKRYVDSCLLNVTPEFRGTEHYRRFLKVAAEVELLPSRGVETTAGPSPQPEIASERSRSEAAAAEPETLQDRSHEAISPAIKKGTLWSRLMEKATATSYRSAGGPAVSFRLAWAEDGATPPLEAAIFGRFAEGGREWAFACYELWEIEGNPDLAVSETPLRRRSLGCRFWHRGASAEFRFGRSGASNRVGYSRDWKEVRPPQPPVIPKPFEGTVATLQQLLNGETVDANQAIIPNGWGQWTRAAELALIDLGDRIEPPAWSDQGEAIFLGE